MAVKFIVNGVVAPGVYIKWKYLDHPTVFSSVPQYFEHNVATFVRRLHLPIGSPVEVLNGTVEDTKVNLAKPEPKVTETEPIDTPVTENGIFINGTFTTTLLPIVDSIDSDSIVAEKSSLPEGISNTRDITTTKRPKDRKTS